MSAIKLSIFVIVVPSSSLRFTIDHKESSTSSHISVKILEEWRLWVLRSKFVDLTYKLAVRKSQELDISLTEELRDTNKLLADVPL